MADFSLVRWTTCQACDGTRFVSGTVKNNTSSIKTIIMVIGDNNANNVGQLSQSVSGNELYNFDITTSLPFNYTDKVYCGGWVGSISQFNPYKNQEFDTEDGCKAPDKPTSLSATCQSDGGCLISWTKPSDGDIFTYIIDRFKNNVRETSFVNDSTSFTDNTITNCSTAYSYEVYAIDKCLNSGLKSTRVTAVPYTEPEGFLELKSFIFNNANTNAIITEAEEGQLVKAIFTVESEFSDDFWVVASIGTTQIYNQYFSLNGTDLKTIVTNSWTMGTTDSILTIILRHKTNIVAYTEDLHTTRTLYYKEPLIKPECIGYITQQTCEDNGCYWWSDNTCQNAPDGTTEFFDIYIKPFSWYEGKYEDALNKTLTLTSDMGGKINNFMESIISISGVKYNGIEIFEDQNKNVIIIRIYLKEININTLAIPLVLLPYLPEIVLILTALLAVALIGIIIGTSNESFTKEEVARDVIGTYYSEDVIGCLQNYLSINRNEAKDFLECLDISQEKNESTNNCYNLLEFDTEAPDVKIKILNFLTCMKVTEETKGIIGADIFDDPTWKDNADKNLIELDNQIIKLENDETTSREALEGGNKVKTNSEGETNDLADGYEDEDCYIDNPLDPTKCLLTNEQANAIKWVLIIGGGLYTLTVLSPLIKGAGHVVERITKK